MRKIIALTVLLSLILAGCQSSERLTTMTIVQALGVDMEEDKTTVSVQYLNLTKSASSTESLSGNITDTAQGTGNSISKAISDASNSLSRELFFGQNKVIVFGSEYAGQDFNIALDFLLRSVDSRPDVLVAMSAERADEIIKNSERGARIPAENIEKMLKLGEEKGLGGAVTVNELLNLYNDSCSDVYLPVLKAENDNVRCSGIAVFSEEKLACVLDESESFGFLFIKNRIKSGVIGVNCEKLGMVEMNIVSASSKLRFSLKKGAEIKCKINIALILNEIENGASSTLTQEDISKIESETELEVKKTAKSAFEKCYNSKSDPFMSSRYASKESAAYYNANEREWRNNLQNIKPSVEVNATVMRVNSNPES